MQGSAQYDPLLYRPDQCVSNQHLVTVLCDTKSVFPCQTNHEVNPQTCCSSVQHPKPQKVHSQDSPTIPRFNATSCDNDVEFTACCLTWVAWPDASCRFCCCSCCIRSSLACMDCWASARSWSCCCCTCSDCSCKTSAGTPCTPHP